MRTPTVLALFAGLASPCLALDLTGRIHWNELCPNISTLGHAKAVLDDGHAHYGGITREGSFTIPNVEPGTYILSVVAHDHAFDKLRVDVPATDASEALPEIRPYVPGTPLSNSAQALAAAPKLPYPPTLVARRQNEYFVERESFNAMGMLQNPMMMMMVVAGGLMIATPYLMKNMDPEALADLQNRQAAVAGIQSSLQSGDLRGGLSALLDVGSDNKPAAPPTPAAQSGVRSRPGKAKRK